MIKKWEKLTNSKWNNKKYKNRWSKIILIQPHAIRVSQLKFKKNNPKSKMMISLNLIYKTSKTCESNSILMKATKVCLRMITNFLYSSISKINKKISIREWNLNNRNHNKTRRISFICKKSSIFNHTHSILRVKIATSPTTSIMK
jgi:hypothetical protein